MDPLAESVASLGVNDVAVADCLEVAPTLVSLFFSCPSLISNDCFILVSRVFFPTQTSILPWLYLLSRYVQS